MSNLLVIKGANIGMRYDLGKTTAIGRAPENHIQLLDPNVSRFHCEIGQRGLSYQIKDLGSKNGVVVNGEPVHEKTLQRNDEVIIGGTYFLFNTDHDLKNTRFSNKRVYFTSPTDSTITPLEDTARLSIGAGAPPSTQRDRATIELLHHLGTLFAFSRLPLPEALERVLQTLANVFEARRACLLTWDPVSSDFVPLVAVSEKEAFTIPLNVLRTVLQEKHSVLLHTLALDKDVAAALHMEYPPETPGDKSVSLCVPLMKNDFFAPQTSSGKPASPRHADDTRHHGERHGSGNTGQIAGLLYMEIPDGDNLLLHDVRLLESVANLTQVAIEHYEILDNMDRGKKEEKSETQPLIGRSFSFTQVLTLVTKVAVADSTVMLLGETGTGKEMIAREIHRLSPRRKYPFIAVNCAAIPETLIESELFGHERGAFTGADHMRRGLIENSHGGTLFLDEIGDMAPSAQTKLLRFLQERVITRVGGAQNIRVDVRIIAATNANLEEAVQQRRFREDLWYRLNVFSINLPPLRQRREDISLLADHFLRRYARDYHKQLAGITDDALHLLESYPWPGNIRELQNALERAVLLSDGVLLRSEDFSLQRRDTSPRAVDPYETTAGGTDLAEAEKECIVRALESCEWNQVQAARILNIHRNTLRKKIAEYNLRPSKID